MIKEKLKLLPDEPGCYLMKNSQNEIIYVGKAKSLKNRVKQYFTGYHEGKTLRLVLEIVDFEYIITQSEKDSLLLEINLIKEYNPKYNIALKDGKTYPYIKLDPKNTPLLSITRNKKQKNVYHYGPFPNVFDAKNTINLLNQIYGLYESKYLIAKESQAYILQTQKGKYRAQYSVNTTIINEIKRFLEGDTKKIVSEIQSKMQYYSENLEFEKAQQQLLLLQSIEHVVSKNQVQLKDKSNQDIFNYAFAKGYMCIQIFMIRMGKLIERNFKVFDIYQNPEDEFLTFLLNYYQNNDLPKQIIIPSEIPIENISELLNTKIIQPLKGEKKAMLLTVHNNAQKQLQNHFLLAQRDDQIQVVWSELQAILGFNVHKVEVFDNSHLASSHNVSGMIVVEEGIFNKKEYRHFKLDNYISDVHSMQEVIYRRYFRLLNEDRPLPDAIFVDGGMQQVQIAQDTLSSLGLKIPIFGLTKDDMHKSAKLIDQNYQSLDIDKKSAVFFLLTRIQDEVHRYVISYHKHIRSKALFKSFLDDIPGLGVARKEKLLKHFKTVKNIKEASVEELSKVIPKQIALNIKNKTTS